MQRRRFVKATCLGFGAVVPAWSSADRPAIEVLSHYDFPPFVIGPGTGLSHDLIRCLDSEFRLRCEFSPLPRLRLDRRLAEHSWQGLVPWVNPVWFGDAARTRYIWSAALFTDEDLVILRPGLRLDYQNISSLRGLTLGGVIGHVYADADPEVAAGRMRREDAISMEHTLRKLLLGRVDVAFLSRSGLRWWAGQLPDLRTSASIASQPRQRFQRHLLLSPRMPAQTREALLQAVLDMPRNSLWRAMLEQHGLRAD